MSSMSYLRGEDIFQTELQAIVNPVNTLGVSGAGLAKQFALNYPEQNKLYQTACREGLCDIGKCYVAINEFPTSYIIYFPTKKHFKDKSQYEYIEKGLKSLIEIIDLYKIRSIAIPALGCGLGGLDQEVVIPMIVKALWGKDLRFDIYMK